jgi:hypothetical protein
MPPEDKSSPQKSKKQALASNRTQVEQERLQVEKKERLREDQELRKALEERNSYDRSAELKSWIQVAIMAAQKREAKVTLATRPLAVIPEAAQAADNHRNRSARSGSQALIDLQCFVRQMKAEGLTQREMCEHLDANRKLRPEGSRWAWQTWQKAYLSQKYTGSVKKWLSAAGRVTA